MKCEFILGRNIGLTDGVGYMSHLADMSHSKDSGTVVGFIFLQAGYLDFGGRISTHSGMGSQKRVFKLT